MRQIKFLVVLFVLVGAGVALWYYTTRAVKPLKSAEPTEDQGYMLEEAPADTAVADTLGMIQ